MQVISSESECAERLTVSHTYSDRTAILKPFDVGGFLQLRIRMFFDLFNINFIKFGKTSANFTKLFNNNKTFLPENDTNSAFA